MNVLFSSFTCKSDSGSESETSFQILLCALKLGYKVTVVTQEKHITRINDNIPEQYLLNLNCIAVRSPALLSIRCLEKKKFSLYIRYLVFQHDVGKLIKKYTTNEFDIVHHTSFGNIWLPIGLRKASIPIVIGPVGGMGRIPLNLWKYLGIVGIVNEISHRFISFLGFQMYGKEILRTAKFILSANISDMQLFSKYSKNIALKPHPIFESSFGVANNESLSKSDLIVYAGRLIHWKGLVALIHAFESVAKDLKLIIIGKGPDLKRLKRISARRGLENKVVFIGELPKNQVLNYLKSARLVVNPSFRDSSGWLLAEALSLGVPAIGFKLNGVGTVLEVSGIEGVEYHRNPTNELSQALTRSDSLGDISSFSAEHMSNLLRQIYKSSV